MKQGHFSSVLHIIIVIAFYGDECQCVRILSFQCNNPLTKEPKLSAAMRIVPEWIDYDNEARSLWDQIYPKSGTTGSTSTTTGSTTTTQGKSYSLNL